jgi:hypothetical protein
MVIRSSVVLDDQQPAAETVIGHSWPAPGRPSREATRKVVPLADLRLTSMVPP